MRGIAALIATAFLIVGPPAPILHAQAQVGDSSLTGFVCAQPDYPVYREQPDGGAPQDACTGQFLPNATVHLTKPGISGTAVGAVDRTATTTAKGSYAFSGLSDGDYGLAVSRMGFSSWSGTVTVSGPTGQDAMLAGQKVTARGTVVAPDGAGIVGATVSICCPPSVGQTQTTTGTGGAFSLASVSGYRSVYVSDAPGFQTLSREMLVDGSALRLQLDRVPPQDATLQGLVSDQAGAAQAGIRIDVYDSRGGCCEPGPYAYDCATPAGGETFAPCGMPYYGGQNHTFSGSDGRYSIHVYGGSSVSIQVNVDGYAPYNAYPQVDYGQTVTHDIQLMKYPPKTAHLVGTVKDEAGKGLGLVSISVRSPQYGLYECSDNGQSGGAGYGTATVQPMSMQAEPARPTPYPQPYPAPACAIQVDSDGSFEGKVSPGYAIVEVYYQQYLACTTTTDADGTSTTTCGPDYYPWVQTLSLPADADTALDIVLRMRARPDAVVAGYAVDGSTQKAIPHASVSFTNLDNNAGGMAQTDADGSFKVRLHSGLHRVSVFAEGFLSWEGTLDVPAGETAYDVILTPGHDAYGGCYSYCVMEGKPVPATVAGPYTTTATPSAAPGGGAPSPTGGAPPDGLDSDQKEAGAADNAFQDLGGGLGPYDPVARQKATEAQGKASPHVELAAAVAVLALVALVRRRLPA